MASEPQSYANHSRYVPGFHFVTSTIFAINFFWTLYNVIRFPSLAAAFSLLLAIGLLLFFYYIRTFPLVVQDRVIRLEERLRIVRLAPDLAPRIDQFTAHQLIALRFASDEELPALAKRALDEKMHARDEIKKVVKNWRSDDMRA